MEIRNSHVVAACNLLAVTLFSNSIAARSGSDPMTEHAADSAIEKLEQEGYEGSVLVAQGGDIMYFRNSGFKDTSCVPSYWIASITKQFVAIGILLLQERELLNIQDSIAVYLPDVPAEKSEITLFQLLTHTSGLQQRYAADGISDRAAALNALLAADLGTEPGTEFAYANDNYNLLAMILEIRSGQMYEEFLQKEILLPSGMKNSGFWGMPVETGTCVPPVAADLEDGISRANWGFRGATGMRASVQDLHAFMLALQSHSLLSGESTDMLMGSHLRLSSGTEIGFNWFGRRTDRGYFIQFSRGHESFGGNAVIYHYPEHGKTIITATNAGPAETGKGAVEGWSRKTHRELAAIFVDQ